MRGILLIDIGSTYTKITAASVENTCIIGTSNAFTTINTDIREGLSNAIKNLESKVGKINYTEKYICSSAAGGLKMITIGLVPDLTTEASKKAALCAGAKVQNVYSYNLNQNELSEIQAQKPDIILLTGGTDGGNKETILNNAKLLASLDGSFSIVVAGNKSASDEVANILSKSTFDVTICENVMPELNVLNIEPTRNAIRNIFLKKIVFAKGLSCIQRDYGEVIMPTPSAVLSATKLLANGYNTESGLGELMVLDVGGATTDVYSISSGEPQKPGVVLKGFMEPYEKRTVEGDLGVRYSIDSLVDSVSLPEISLKAGIPEHEALRYIDLLRTCPDILPQKDTLLKKLDFALTSYAINKAVSRHAGTIETVYTPFGATYIQNGKDLTSIKRIIGTGGPIINSIYIHEVMKASLKEVNDLFLLKPEEAEFLVDKKYILASMGLLAQKHPEIALRIMKNELELV